MTTTWHPFISCHNIRVNAWYNGSILAKITFPISPYKIFKNDSNGYGCYFKKCYYFNLWIIHVQSLTNLPKSTWKLVFNVVDVFFHYYKMWVQFTSPCLVDQWIHSKSSEIIWHTRTPFDVVFKFGNSKRKTHKVHMNNLPCKTFKNICFWDKEIKIKTKIVTHTNLWKYGQIFFHSKVLNY